MTGSVPVTAAGLGRLRPRPPWPVLATAFASGLVVVLFSLLQPDHGLPLALAQLVVALLGASSAFVLDDASAELTAVVPPSLVRRRLKALAKGLPVTASGWCVLMVLFAWRSPELPLETLTWELAGIVSTSVAAAAVVARHGEPEPGNLVAPGVVLVVVGFLVAKPVLPFTLLAVDPTSPVHAEWWAALVVVAAGVFLAASRD